MNTPPVVVWRLAVATSAGLGVWLAAQEYAVWWTALSQLANLAVAVAFVALAVREPRSPWLRGALTAVMVLVSVAYLPMANGNLAHAWSVLEHVVTPGLVLADFLLVGAAGAAVADAGVRWWHPLSWLLAPAAYLCWYVVGDLHVYAALDPARPVAFAGRVLVLVAVLLAVGFALRAARHRRRRVAGWSHELARADPAAAA